MQFFYVALLVLIQQCMGDYTLTVKMQQVEDVLGLLPSGETCDQNAWWCTSVSWPDCAGCDLTLELCATSPTSNCSDPSKYVDFGRVSQDQALVNLTSRRYNGVENPVSYRLLGPWTGSELFINLGDLDMLSPNDHIDNFGVALDAMTGPGSGFHAVSYTHHNGNATTKVMFAFSVDCQDFFGGQTCVKECTNGGSMVNGSCVCPDPYTGMHCQDLMCKNNGTSFDGKCVCPPGLTGSLCEEIICHNAGWPLANLTCQCTATFTGKHCDTPICQHNMTLQNNKCDCGSLWTGQFCQTIVCGEHGYHTNGTTTAGECMCDMHWTGIRCKERICEYNGVLDANNTCECPAMFTGEFCEIGPRRHCQDLLDYYSEETGVRQVVTPSGGRGQVYCEMVGTIGYTVFQRRTGSKQSFDWGWTFYQMGFGKMTDDFYWGNAHLHEFTNAYDFGLRVEVTDCNGTTWFEQYPSVKIGSQNDSYNLIVSPAGTPTGNAGDALNFKVQDLTENGMKFTTNDQDNDKFPPVNCAKVLSGGWWYSACGGSNLNGVFDPACADSGRGINWFTVTYSQYSMKASKMMLVAN